MSRLDVKPGQEVKRGQTIGAVGATGRVTGPHLCFRYNWRESRLDPQLLLPTHGEGATH
jgi:murein DD-endopeptidase MepM/ murein hydrolase activator NlpD